MCYIHNSLVNNIDLETPQITFSYHFKKEGSGNLL